MPYIYEPTGKAKEYSDLALNIYIQCDHGCKYCYVPSIRRPDPAGIKHRLDLGKLDKECETVDRTKRILLCFMTDPYCHKDVELQDTRRTLEILLKHQLPVSLLTKGGRRLYRDLDLIRQFKDIKVGATLTLTDETMLREWEKDAAPTSERIEMLRTLHEAGVRTWASMEPVIDPQQSLELMAVTLPFVDEYKIGKLNHDKIHESGIDWREFGQKAVELMEQNHKSYYIKEDLKKWLKQT